MSEDQGEQVSIGKVSDGVHGTLVTTPCPCCGKPLRMLIGDDGRLLFLDAPGAPSAAGDTDSE